MHNIDYVKNIDWFELNQKKFCLCDSTIIKTPKIPETKFSVVCVCECVVCVVLLCLSGDVVQSSIFARERDQVYVG